MSTFIEVQNRVNDDFLNRNLGAETRRAIQAAVRHYERRRWSFNETSTALTTSSSISYLTLPSNFLILDDLRITYGTETLPLIAVNPQYIRDNRVSSNNGVPTGYAIYRNRIELLPTPDSAYSAPLYYIKSLDTLSADSDTNAWITGAMEDLTAYHAAKLLWATVLRNDREAAKFAALEQTSLSNVTSHTEQRLTPGRITPTRF